MREGSSNCQRSVKESWFVRQDFGLNFWNDEREGILEGLLKKRPLFFTGFSEGEPYREFKTLEEITHCQSALDEIMAVDHALSLLFAQGAIAHPVIAYQPVTYKNLLLTCWARDHLGLPEETEPLAVDKLKALFRDLWGRKARPRRVDKKMKQAFLDWLQMGSGQTIDEILDRVNKTIDRLFDELEKEYGSVVLKDLDPRYIKHFLITP